MITLKITAKKQGTDFEKVGDYYIYFNGEFMKESREKRKIYLKFDNQLLGFIDKEKRSVEIFRNIEKGLPLYYFIGFKKIIISSHLKFFIKEGLKLTENKEVVTELLSYGYVLPPKTVYENIFKVPLLKRIVIKLDNNLNLIEKELFAFNQENRDEQLSKFIENNISFNKNKKHTLLFSGGLDSSILCKLMKKQRTKFNMLSTGFNFKSEDLIEKRYALSASEKLKKKTDYISFDFDKLLLLIPEVISISEEPINHIQTMLLYGLMKENKNKIFRTLVSGQGADGIFGTDSQFNLLKNKRKSDILELKILKFNFLKGDYQKQYDNKKRFLRKIKKYADIDKDFILDLEGDVDTTLNSWTKCANHNSHSIVYPLFKKVFIERIIKTKWGERLKERKFFLRNLARKNDIPETLINRKKGSFGPVSKEWGRHLESILPISYAYFNKKEINDFALDNKNRYVLWNIINYSIWKRIFIERRSYLKVRAQLKNLTYNNDKFSNSIPP